MQIDFAPQGIKIHVKEPRIDTNNEPEYILISLDSAKVYTIKPRNKSYRSHRLTEKMPATEVPAVKDFAGHRAIGELYNEAGVNNIFGSLLSSKTIFYLAENLMYSIPEKYLSNFELMMVQNGKIVLGAEIHMAPKMFFFGSASADDSDSSFNKVIVYIEAKEVIERKFDAADFSVPAGFQKNRPYVYAPEELSIKDSLDSVVITNQYLVDSVVEVTAKPVITNKKKTPSKKKSSPKQNSIRRKED